MDNPQTGDLFFEVASIVSPLIAAAIAAILAYYFAIKGKKLDILYANKVPALKAIAVQVMELSNYISGVLAYLQANEWAGNYRPPGGALGRRGELAQVVTMNNLFLTPHGRAVLSELLNHLALVCAAEVRYVLDPTEHLQPLYESVYNRVKESMEVLHKELYRR
jgi:hypothetical protein